MQRSYTVALVLLLGAPVCLGQLVNGNFESPTVITTCAEDTQDVTGWTAQDGTPHDRRNVKFYTATCPRVAGDTAHASITGWGSTPTPNGLYLYQTVTVVPGQTYTLSGYWAGGHQDGFGNNTLTAEMHDGIDPNSSLIAQAQRVQGMGGFDWLSFSVNGLASSTQMTVVLRTKNGGATGFGMHVNDVQLVPATCLEPPTITAIGTTYGVRGATLDNMSITGNNFTAGKTTVKLKMAGQPDITATDVQVAGNRASLTCDLNLTGVAWGRWDVEVSVGNTSPNQFNCGVDTLGEAFLVVLPQLSNGSFELPTAAGACPAVPIPGHPTDWTPAEIAGYGWADVLFRDSSATPPTCPPPDGLHYASSLSNDSGAAGSYARIFQTIAVTPGSQYVFSGYFAGGGNNLVTLELRDGDVAAPVLASTDVHIPGGAYDWTYALVAGTPTANYATVVWKIDPDGAGPHAAHADNLSFAQCAAPVTVTGITPSIGDVGGVVQITNLEGTGFAGTPVVKLIRAGNTLTASSVQVVSSTQITAEVDLSSATPGVYQVLVLQGACAGTFDSFTVLPVEFTNGSFEQGNPGNPNDMPAWGLLTERPGATMAKTASGEPATVFVTLDKSAFDGQVYAGGAVDTNANFHVALYQMFRTEPGAQYTVSGGLIGGIQSASPGLAWWEVLVVDGASATVADMNSTSGTVIHKVTHDANAPATEFRETFSGQFTATGYAATIFLKWGYVPGDTAIQLAGWDNITVAPQCNAPFADADGDLDVDQLDFAVFQACFSGAQPTPTGAGFEYCTCFDRNSSQTIDQVDLAQFVNCVTGPELPMDVQSPPGNCTP